MRPLLSTLFRVTVVHRGCDEVTFAAKHEHVPVTTVFSPLPRKERSATEASSVNRIQQTPPKIRSVEDPAMRSLLIGAAQPCSRPLQGDHS